MLRVEDIDTPRVVRGMVERQIDDLRWLGIDWDGEPRRQSENFADYRSALNRLETAVLLRPSHATRAEIRAAVAAAEARGEVWPRDPDGAPFPPPGDGDPRPGEPVALRLDGARAAARIGPLDWREVGEGPNGETGRIPVDLAAWGDPVMARKEIPTSYHLSVVVDDALQGVTHVVRGRDLFWSTSVHRALQALLGLPAPIYLHHDLVLDAEGRKLSKSAADTALADLRAGGATPDDIRRLIGWDKTAAEIDRLNRVLSGEA